MTAKLIADGNNAIYKTDVVLAADTGANDIVAMGSLIGIDEVGGEIGDEVALSISGRWEVATGDTFAVGDIAFFNGTSVGLTGSVLLGVAVTATVNGLVQVEINTGTV